MWTRLSRQARRRFPSQTLVAAAATVAVVETYRSNEMDANGHSSRPCLPLSMADCEGLSLMGRISNTISRQNTFRRMEHLAERETLEARYAVEWRTPIGEGSFGSVYTAKDRQTGELVAVKKISKRATCDESFQREMDALLHIRAHGGHPNICGLRANYDQGDYYYLVLDLVLGGEMFDHLCRHGAYSEADAARLVREVASALAFLHGLNTVHGDLKPENRKLQMLDAFHNLPIAHLFSSAVMLSSEKSSAAVVKVVDFGSAQINQEDTGIERAPRPVAATPAYSPPEFLERGKKDSHIDPSFDMWALGVIVYIMLTGVHPFDLYGNATDEEIEHEIRSGHRPPTKRSPLTAHLSPHAIRLLEKLLEWDPKRRMTALELLENPWVRGETARRKKMADSDKRLAAFRTFKTKLEAKVFADMVAWTDDKNEGVAKRTSLIERAFRVLDPDDRGYVTTKELRKIADENDDGHDEHDHDQLSLSGFSDLLAENMKNRYFSKGHIVYHEGDEGHAMYFINSGTVEVFTSDGSKQVRHTGDCFGEGALLHPKKIRSASIRCLTPVHAIEISREYFEKYLASDENVKLNLREKDKGRKRQRAKTILQLQQNMKEKTIGKGEAVFRVGEQGNELYVLEEGLINLSLEGHTVSSVHPGEMTGEHSLIFGKPRNVDAICVSDKCKMQSLRAKDFYLLLDSHPSLKEGIRDICYRREFQKALCFKLNKCFPRNEEELKEAFDAIDTGKTGVIELRHVRTMIQRFDATYTEEDVRDILNSLALHEPGKVTWAEFLHIFGMDKDQESQ